MPAGVPAATETLPVAVSNVRAAGTVEPVATLKIALAEVAAAPLTLLPVSALMTLLAPLAPLTPVTELDVATTGDATTVTEIVAVVQLPGLSASQI